MNYVTLDIETSGLNSDTAEIIEIGACKVVDDVVVDTFSSVIKPQNALSPQVEQLTGLSAEFFVGAPEADEVMRRFVEFVQTDTVVAYNAQFVEGFLCAAYERCGLRCDYHWIDVYKLAKEKLQGKTDGYRQWQLCRYYKISNDRSGCFADAVVTHKIYRKLAQEQ